MAGQSRARWARAYAVVPAIAALAAGGLAALDPFRVDGSVLQYTGAVPLFAGLGLVVWTALTVQRAGETLSPVARPERLVTTGAFALTRNPMYLGVVLTAAGVALLAGSPVAAGYTGLLWLTYHVVVVAVEEPKLRAAFGAEYDRYCEQVRRWVPARRTANSGSQ